MINDKYGNYYYMYFFSNFENIDQQCNIFYNYIRNNFEQVKQLKGAKRIIGKITHKIFSILKTHLHNKTIKSRHMSMTYHARSEHFFETASNNIKITTGFQSKDYIKGQKM